MRHFCYDLINNNIHHYQVRKEFITRSNLRNLRESTIGKFNIKSQTIRLSNVASLNQMCKFLNIVNDSFDESEPRI